MKTINKLNLSRKNFVSVNRFERRELSEQFAKRPFHWTAQCREQDSLRRVTGEDALHVPCFGIRTVSKCCEWTEKLRIAMKHVDVHVVQSVVDLAFLEQKRVVTRTKHNSRQVANKTVTKLQGLELDTMNVLVDDPESSLRFQHFYFIQSVFYCTHHNRITGHGQRHDGGINARTPRALVAWRQRSGPRHKYAVPTAHIGRPKAKGICYPKAVISKEPRLKRGYTFRDARPLHVKHVLARHVRCCFAGFVQPRNERKFCIAKTIRGDPGVM